MRSLNRNKTKLWAVAPVTLTPVLDSDGFNTGETTKTYSAPIEIELMIYPSNGAIVEQLFGKDSKFDMAAVSTSVELSVNTLLFTSLPTKNYSTTYVYRIGEFKKSLNTYQYGLVRRT